MIYLKVNWSIIIPVEQKDLGAFFSNEEMKNEITEQDLANRLSKLYEDGEADIFAEFGSTEDDRIEVEATTYDEYLAYRSQEED